MVFFDEENSSKRSLGIRDKQILYRNAKGRCENPACRKKIEFDEMQVGHKIAWSRGGKTTLANSVCLCYRCNKLQGTDSWVTFLKKQGITNKNPKAEIKKALTELTVEQLKSLATKYKVKVTGTLVEGWLDSHRKPATKIQYINKLMGVVTLKDIKSI